MAISLEDSRRKEGKLSVRISRLSSSPTRDSIFPGKFLRIVTGKMQQRYLPRSSASASPISYSISDSISYAKPISCVRLSVSIEIYSGPSLETVRRTSGPVSLLPRPISPTSYASCWRVASNLFIRFLLISARRVFPFDP